MWLGKVLNTSSLRWHDSVDTRRSSVIICQLIVHRLVIVQNKKISEYFELPGSVSHQHCSLLIQSSITDAKQSLHSTASLRDALSRVWSVLNTLVFGGERGRTGNVLSPQYLGNPLPVIIPKVAAVHTALDTVLFKVYKNWPFTAIEFLIQYYKVV